MDRVHQKVFNKLNPKREHLSLNFVGIMSNNIAFLIKNASGFKLDPNQVSLVIIDIYGRNGEKVGQRATVAVHKSEGEFEVVVEEEVGEGEYVIEALNVKVDVVVRNVLMQKMEGAWGSREGV